MSTIPAGYIQPPGLSNIQPRTEHVPDLVQFFQAQESLSSGSSQSGGAREIFKAGQRRLRQLAQRPRRGNDPQTKTEEASRQLLALQQEGFLPISLPAPKTKKSAPKRSIDSTVSSSLSTSNHSFQSSSRREVESIGQPWLESSLQRLDTRETKGSRLSSLDLRDFTSLIDAAGPHPPRLEDVTPPPYQPSAQLNNPPKDNRDSQDHSFNPETRNISTSSVSEPVDEIEALPKFPDIPDRTSSHHAKMSVSIISSDNKQQLNPEQSEALKLREHKDVPEAAGRRSPLTNAPNTIPSHSNPAVQTLKLFPDTTPPRMPNKGALRISNGCPSPAMGSLQTTPAQQSSSAASTPQSDGKTKPASRTSGCDDEFEKPSRMGHVPQMQPASLNKSTVSNPGHEKLSVARNSRRPASLPMGAIDAFPLPAPMRPLPALPEGVAGIRPIHGHEAHTSRKSPQVVQRQQDSQLPPRSTEDGPKGSSVKRVNHVSIPGRTASDTTNPGIAKDRGHELSKADTSSPTIPVPSVRDVQSRAERVCALKKKDMSASRIYLKDSDSRPLERGRSLSSRLSERTSSEKYGEATVAPRDRDEGAHNRCERGLADTHSPPLSPVSWNSPEPSTEAHATGNNGSSLDWAHATSFDTRGHSSLPASKRNSHCYPSGGARSTSVLGERLNNELDLFERSATPLASSEDEAVDFGSHKQQPHPISSRRRQPRLASIEVGEPATHKTRHTKKPSSYDYSRPITPRNRRSHGLEKASPQSPYYYHEKRGSRHRPSYVRELEKRIAHLEHLNKTLQAALLAALDVGGKQNVEGLLGGSSTSLSTTPTGRSFSSMTNTSSSPDSHVMRNERAARRRQPPYRPETWIASPGSSQRSSYGSEASADIRELENMIEDFDFGWVSDQSNPESTQKLKLRA
ncbi:hypothetical protein BDV23DRAFT_185749 [Aspergillus alliaceus]|uniref:Uncharacterized protein n=1 Tax=Petromyces alliaceus TaxID=209559 RepID=A0A5N7C1P0_PETAA|nr:hypothetical protein BDV23DRAFT_185749 [Aspergillus alliaceus]